MNCFSTTAEGVIVNIRVVPRASRNEVAGWMGDAVKIRLTAPPVEGKANKALTGFLAEALHVHRRDVSILSGNTGRNKRILVAGVTEDHVRESLGLSGPG